MSRSESHRFAHISAERRAELGRASRYECLSDVVPALRLQVSDVVRTSSVDLRTRQVLDERLASSATVEDLRAVVVDLTANAGHETGGVAPPAPRLASDSFSRPTPSSGASLRAVVRFDLEALAGERGWVARAADAASVSVPELVDVDRSIDEASSLVQAGRVDLAALAVDDARASLAECTDRVSDARAAAECRSRSLDAVAAALREIGYAPQPPVADGNGTVVVALASGGRRAVVDITGSGEPVDIAASFTDVGDAVPLTDARAGDGCDPAERDEGLFTSTMSDQAGLEVTVDARRTRSQRGVKRAKGWSSSRRAGRVENHNNKRSL